MQNPTQHLESRSQGYGQQHIYITVTSHPYRVGQNIFFNSSSHVFVCKGHRFCLILRFFYQIVDLFGQCIIDFFYHVFYYYSFVKKSLHLSGSKLQVLQHMFIRFNYKKYVSQTPFPHVYPQSQKYFTLYAFNWRAKSYQKVTDSF